jgi:hypothetical protein
MVVEMSFGGPSPRCVESMHAEYPHALRAESSGQLLDIDQRVELSMIAAESITSSV